VHIKISVPKSDEESEEFKIVCNNELHHLSRSPSIILLNEGS